MKELYHALAGRVARLMPTHNVPEIDGLRCLAIGFVLFWHASVRASRHYGHSPQADNVGTYYDYVPHGEIGVALFFFISGFIVSQPFLRTPRKEWRFGSFYRRRFLRIYPPYLIALTACFLVLGGLGHVPVDANSFNNSEISLTRSFIYSIAAIHSVALDAPSRLNPPMWSLEIEAIFYAVLPTVMLVYCRFPRGNARVASAIAAIGLTIIFSSIAVSPGVDSRLRWGFLLHAHLFLMGIVAADCFRGRIQNKTPSWDGCFLIGLILLVGAGLVMTRTDARMSHPLYAMGMQCSTALAIIMLFIGASFGTSTSRFLSINIIRLIGIMCYSVYLTHIAVMTAASELLSRVASANDPTLIYGVFFCVLIPASLVGGFLFFVSVEHPLARLLAEQTGRLSNPRRRPALAGMPERVPENEVLHSATAT